MRKAKRYTVPKRRRRENKTNYKARLKMLSSGTPRLVVRRSNQYIIAQIVESKEAQDSIVCAANSRELRKYGWNHGKKNLPAAYLTCFLLVKKGKDRAKEAILDLGLRRSTRGSGIYACLKGAVDAGLKVSHSEEMLPKEDRIKGRHINKELEKSFEDTKQKISEL